MRTIRGEGGREDHHVVVGAVAGVHSVWQWDVSERDGMWSGPQQVQWQIWWWLGPQGYKMRQIGISEIRQRSTHRGLKE